MKRSTLKRTQPKRDWEDALAKVRSEGQCRSCGANEWRHQYDQEVYGLEAAHLIGRKYDPVRVGPRGGKYKYVEPLGIVPLCWRCHQEYDARLLSLLDVVTYEEYSYCIEIVGRERARRRITGSRKD